MQLCIQLYSCTCRWRSPSPPPSCVVAAHGGDPGALARAGRGSIPYTTRHTHVLQPDPPPRRAGALIGEWHSRMGNKARAGARSHDTVYGVAVGPSLTPYSAPTRHQLLDASQTSLTGGRCSQWPAVDPSHPLPAALQLHPPRTVTNEHRRSSSRGCGLRATRRASLRSHTQTNSEIRVERFPTHTRRSHVLKQPHNHPYARPHHPRTPPHRTAV